MPEERVGVELLLVVLTFDATVMLFTISNNYVRFTEKEPSQDFALFFADTQPVFARLQVLLHNLFLLRSKVVLIEFYAVGV